MKCQVMIDRFNKPNDAGKQEEWYVVDICIDGVSYGCGDCPNTGIFKREDYAERTAISRAWFNFDQRLVRGAEVVRIQSTPGGSGPPESDGNNGEPRRGSVEALDSGSRPDWHGLFNRQW